MKLLFDVCHPAHVHLFKNAIHDLQKKGHEIKITARDKDITLTLLDAYKFEYELIDTHQKTLVTKALGMFIKNYKLLKIVNKFKPDILVSAGSPSVAHVSKIIKKPSIAFVDTEHANLTGKLTYPFTNVICTPSCYGRDHGKKQIRYNGYHELAYLHPNYFSPDSSILDEFGLDRNCKFTVMRLVSWKATHDIRDKGLTNIDKVIKKLERHGQIFITSEKKLPQKFEKYMITIPPEKIHHLLYFSSLYVGESAKMATESALLGVPSIFVSTSRRGYTDELENKYELVYNYSDSKRQEDALKKAVEILENENSKKEWGQKRRKMLDEKIDVTEFMTELIEGYPESFYEFKQDENQ